MSFKKLNAQTLTLESYNLPVSYLDKGKGEPLLMIHGWLGIKEVFTPYINYLSSKHRIIVPDLPGFGETSVFSNESLSINLYLNFLIDFIDKLNLKKVNICANSFGGVFAILLATKYHSRINKLILHSPLFWNKFLPISIRNPLSREFFRLTSKPKLLEELYAKIITWQFLEKVLVGKANMFNQKSTNIVNNIAELFRENLETRISRRAAKHLIFEGLRINLCSHIQILKNPTLIIWGKRDRLNSYDGAIYLNQHIKSSKLITTDKPHSILSENFKYLARIINKFLA